MTTKTINLKVIQIVYETGKDEIIVVNQRQWSARWNNKKYRKSIIDTTNLASIHIKIKTK